MIAFYFPNKQIHQYFMGFGAVTEKNGTLHIDGRDTTTNAGDVNWKYIADQVLEQDENGYVHDADYYEAFEPLPTADSRIAAIEMYLLEQELGL